MKTKNYIEFRVYFENNTPPEFVDEVADNLQDIIIDYIGVKGIDYIGVEGLPHFSQDVTYEKVVEEKK